MTKLPVVLGVLTYLGGLTATARPLEQAAQSQKKSREPSSRASLTLREKSRRSTPKGEAVTYVLQADGLPQGKSYKFSGRRMDGSTGASPEVLHVDGSGRVLSKDGSEFELTLGGMFAGEFTIFTLASEDGTAKAAVEITPFPIEAVGKGGCRLWVKPASIKGDIFSVTGEGFKPGQEIKTVASFSGEVIKGRADNKDGNLKIFLWPAVRGRNGGEGSLTASDESCSVTIRYAWGDAMTRLSPTANRAANEAQATPAAPRLPVQAQAGPQDAESPADTLAKAEAAYRRSDHDAAVRLLRELASRESTFTERYRKAAVQGSATAQGMLGVIYEEGIGVSKDSVEAVRWFRKAADQGDPAGQKYLGDMYRNGQGVPRDFAEAVKLYRKAAEQGDGPGQAMLGVVYGEGFDAQPGFYLDLTQAYMWLTLASSRFEGKERDITMALLDRLSAGMSKAAIEKAQQLAREWKPTSGPAVSAQQSERGHPPGADAAYRAVDLDDELWILDFMFVRGHPGTLHLGKEKVTQDNAKGVLERLQLERRKLADDIDRAGLSNIGGDYDLLQAPLDQCKLSAPPFGDRRADAAGPLTMVQNEHAVELKSKSLQGCGVAAGAVVVMRRRECGGSTTPIRLMGRVTDQGIEMMFFDKANGSRCLLGTLTRRPANASQQDESQFGKVCVARSPSGRWGIAWGSTDDQCERATKSCGASGVSDCRTAETWAFSLKEENGVSVTCANGVAKKFSGVGAQPLQQAFEFAKRKSRCAIRKSD
jgi:TPR repeat protein